MQAFQGCCSSPAPIAGPLILLSDQDQSGVIHATYDIGQVLLRTGQDPVVSPFWYQEGEIAHSESVLSWSMIASWHAMAVLHNQNVGDASRLAELWTLGKKRKEKFTLYSDHNGGLLRRQSRVSCPPLEFKVLAYIFTTNWFDVDLACLYRHMHLSIWHSSLP